MDTSAEPRVKEGRPDCVNTQVQALQDVRNFDREERWRLSGSLLRRLRRTSHVPDEKLTPMGDHRSVPVILNWNDVKQTFENPGTVFGSGFDCRTGKVYTFERQTDGMWNKVQQNIDFKGQVNLDQSSD